MTKLLIITGPQGSGNHLMAKLFAVHPAVGGWKKLLDRYWISHDEEPFADVWSGHGELTLDRFSGADYWVTGVSVPFMDDGEVRMPDVERFVRKAQALEIDVMIGIIVRDGNIVRMQQRRARSAETLPAALETYSELMNAGIAPVYFLDFEAAFLYGPKYLQWLSRLLDFPLDAENPAILEILQEDANAKYVQYVEHNWLDEEVKRVSRPKAARL